jgi:alkyldihydroxyacetonephosphate synthase
LKYNPENKETAMFRWNGWGDASITMDLPSQADDLLRELIGPGVPVADYPLEQFLVQVPQSRLALHPLISTDPRDRLVHAHGQSLPDWVAMRQGLLRRFPDGVAHPSHAAELETVLRLAGAQHWLVIPYGGGTSVVGHLEVPAGDRPVLSVSLSRLCRLVHLDPVSRLATFEAGVRGPDLEAQLRGHGFTLGHYPQSFEYSTLGGWVVTRSSGQQSTHYGRIEGLFAGGRVITPRGEMTLPPWPASAAGPDLRHLVLGSEGRMGVLSQATVRVTAIADRDDVVGVFFPDWNAGVTAARRLAGIGVPFSMLRLSNAAETMTHLAIAGHAQLIRWLKRYLRVRSIPEAGACMCLVGFTGTKRLTRVARAEATAVFRREKGVPIGTAMGTAWKKNRFQGPYLRNTLWDMGYAVDTLETAVSWDKVTPTMQAVEGAIRNALIPWNETVHVFSHLSHVYPTGSSIYTSYVWRIASDAQETLARWQAIKTAACREIVRAGGTISHQHGVGVDHAPYLPAEKGALGMGALRSLFNYFDPESRMNPGKLLSPEAGHESG